MNDHRTPPHLDRLEQIRALQARYRHLELELAKSVLRARDRRELIPQELATATIYLRELAELLEQTEVYPEPSTTARILRSFTALIVLQMEAP
jgi:hypothetical protein